MVTRESFEGRRRAASTGLHHRTHNNLGQRCGCWPCCSCSGSSAVPALLPASRTALVSPTLRRLAVALLLDPGRPPPPSVPPATLPALAAAAGSDWPPSARLPQPGSTPTASRSRRTVATSSSWVMFTTGAHRHIFCCPASPPWRDPRGLTAVCGGAVPGTARRRRS